MIYLEDIVLHEPIACGSFRLTRDEIVAFAAVFDPQPFHLDEAGGERSYFGRLVASGLHTQGAAIGLMVRRLSNLAVIAGRSLNTTRFHRPTLPDEDYTVAASWTERTYSTRDPRRGTATIAGTIHDAAGVLTTEFGVTYVLARRPAD
jgi:acyl dehydratase